MPASGPFSPLMVGQVVAHYRILEKIAAGGMGVSEASCGLAFCYSGGGRISLRGRKVSGRARREALCIMRLERPGEDIV